MATASLGETGDVVRHWSLRFRIFLFFALIAAGSVVSAGAGAYFASLRLDPAQPQAALVIGAVLSCFAMIALTTWIWFLFDENVAKPLEGLAAELRSRAHADVRAAIDPEKVRYLGDLGPAAAAVSGNLTASRSELDDALKQERERLDQERARLETILQEAPTACLVCSPSHRVALYNERALELLGDLGLDRRLSDMLAPEALSEALAQLGRGDGCATVDLRCAARDGRAVFEGRMRRLSEAQQGGYLLTLREAEQPDGASAAATPGAAPRLDAEASGRLFHDLRVLDGAEAGDDAPLKERSFVVFDTETTGLHPDRDDEVVQIAAVRVVRGRILPNEPFDTLVDPERGIPRSSTEIHGVDASMVAGAPRIDEAGRRFHRYCGDSLLIAHNAHFDLACFKRHAARIGAVFDNPVLDTALMSAILFGRGAEHDLDSIAGRLGAAIDPALRHTALGDAVATAQIAVCMVAMLEAKGVVTLSDYNRAAAPHRDLVIAAT